MAHLLEIIFNKMVIGLLLYFVTVVTLFYLCIYGDSSTNRFARLIKVRLPEMIERLIGKRKMDKLRKTNEYIQYERNPILQIMYCFLITGGWTTMVFCGYPLMPNLYVSDIHQTISYGVFVVNIGSYIYIMKKSPGCVTKDTITLYDNYDYDGIMYYDRTCPTIGIRKIARSKYDSMLKRHVPRYDHYCGWVGNTIGEENYAYFLTFLVVHVLMFWYGSYVTGMIFWSELDKIIYQKRASFIDSKGNRLAVTKLTALRYLIQRHTNLAGLSMLMFIVAIFLSGFIGFHCWLIVNGMTTNEFYKWKAAKVEHDRLLKKYDEAVVKGNLSKGPEHRDELQVDISDDFDVGCVGATNNLSQEAEINNPDQKLIRPRPFPEKFPYKFSLIENIRNVFYPRYLREDAQRRYSEYLQGKKNE